MPDEERHENYRRHMRENKVMLLVEICIVLTTIVGLVLALRGRF